MKQLKRRDGIKGILAVATMPWILLRGQEPFPVGFFAKPVAAAGASCPADGSPSADSGTTADDYRCGQNTSNRRTGQSKWNDGGTPRTICKLAFYVANFTGTVSAKTYNAWIYSMTAANLNAVQATSDNVTGVSGVGWKVFQFSTPFLTSASVNYALIFGPTAPDASNYVWVGATATDVVTGYREIFDDAGVGNFTSGTTDQGIRIYWQ